VRKLSEDLDRAQLNKWIPSSRAAESVRQQQLAALQCQVDLDRQCVLPPKAPQHMDCPTLVLDLDETLVHASSTPPRFRGKSFMIPCSHGGCVHVAVRPGVTTFLAIMAEYFEIVLFTAATQVRARCEPAFQVCTLQWVSCQAPCNMQYLTAALPVQEYAEQVIDILDPDGSVFAHRLYRDCCKLQANGFVKDLRVLGRNLGEVIIIDNTPLCFSLHIDNAIPIPSWESNPADRALLQLIPLLCRLSTLPDVRPTLRAIFRLQEWVAQEHELSAKAERSASRQDACIMPA
jgi:CTD small phosphatase-like protein 2